MNKTASWPFAILFDLDGTLIDSAPDLAKSVNLLLAQHDYCELSIDQVRGMIGNGVAKLVERAFAAKGEVIDGDVLKSRTDKMMVIYNKHLTDESHFLEGAYEAIIDCYNKGIALGVVTNKPEAATRRILKHFELDKLIKVVVGGDTCPTRKPNPEMLIYALHSLGMCIQDGLMVGDSPADIGAANACAMRSIAVRGGYTTVLAEDLGANAVIDNLHELTDAIHQLSQ